MNLSITHKQRWLILTIVVIGITGAAFGIASSGNTVWISLIAPLSIIAFAVFFKNPVRSQQNIRDNQSAVAPSINKLEEMIKLLDLKDHGSISDAEYQERRADLIYNH